MIVNIYWMLMCQALSVSVSVQLLSLVRLFATHEPQHARPPCASPTPGVHPNPGPLSRWCHPTISSSVIPFSSCLQSFQHQGLFQWVSSSHEVAKGLDFQLQHQSFQWTPRTDLLYDGLVGSPCSPRTLKSLLQHHSSKASILLRSPFFIPQLSYPYMTTGKTIALTRQTFTRMVRVRLESSLVWL